MRAAALDLAQRVARGAAAPRLLNATDAGARLLKLPSRARPEAQLRGMPLHLTNCTHSALLAPWQLWRAACGVGGGGGRSSRAGSRPYPDPDPDSDPYSYLYPYSFPYHFPFPDPDSDPNPDPDPAP